MRTEEHTWTWKEKFYGHVRINNCEIETPVDSVGHKIQSSMELKGTKDCDRSWLYKFKNTDCTEIVYGIRFEDTDIAAKFNQDFNSAVNSVKSRVKNMRSIGF